MNKVVLISIFILIIAVFIFFRKNPQQLQIISPLGTSRIESKPLEKFSIESLSTQTFAGSTISIGDITKTTDLFTVRPFYFYSERKKVSGVAHIPIGKGPFPVIIQFRGYVDPSIYTPGMGSERSAEVFAKNGFISLSPDFLGYGQSDPLSGDIFRDRFETYTTAISLIASLANFPQADASRMGIWGHSNGGQIAITTLEILQNPIPTVLWAPVTKPFPYSILYYTDDADDHGKYLRKELALFESLYDVEKYSLTNYVDRISGPIQLHQGGEDDAVPLSWNNAFVQKLKSSGKDVTYFSYPQADHNMTPDWETVVKRDVEFFNKQLNNRSTL